MSSEKRPHILNLDAARRQCGPASEKEVAARAAIEARAGRPLNDLEWARARARLLDFVSVLRAWHRKGTTTASELPMAA
jgi:hypothetical protein